LDSPVILDPILRFLSYYPVFCIPGQFFAISVYGPVTYSPAPVIIFPTTKCADENGDGANDAKVETDNPTHGQELAVAEDYKAAGEYVAAQGTLLPVDPDRIVLKRIVLTGYPVKVKNRLATVKFMFFDVRNVSVFHTTIVFVTDIFLSLF
jgi:pre-rRNA-processing protein TSR1